MRKPIAKASVQRLAPEDVEAITNCTRVMVDTAIGMLKTEMQAQIANVRAIATDTQQSVADQAGSIAPTEDELVGMWMTDQREAGAITVDLKRVEDIRTGIRYALAGGE